MRCTLTGTATALREGHHILGSLNPSPRQPATMVSMPADQVRVCLAAPPTASATPFGFVVHTASSDGQNRDEDTGVLSLGACIVHLLAYWCLVSDPDGRSKFGIPIVGVIFRHEAAYTGDEVTPYRLVRWPQMPSAFVQGDGKLWHCGSH